jgi:hypothetical protein
VTVTATAFDGSFGADDAALARSAGQYAAFLGRPVVLGGAPGRMEPDQIEPGQTEPGQVEK